MRRKTRPAFAWAIAIVLALGLVGVVEANAAQEKKTEGDTVSGIALPVSDKELMGKVTAALSTSGHKPKSLKTVSLGELGRVYVATMDDGQERVFVRLVARRVPCMDCHDVFFVYSFDEKMTFLDFIPLHITKRYNKPWDRDDIDKIRNKFSGKSLFEPVSFDPMVDAVSSATISSKLVFHSINQTGKAYQELVKLGL